MKNLNTIFASSFLIFASVLPALSQTPTDKLRSTMTGTAPTSATKPKQAAAAPPPAPVSNEPTATTAAYGDWVLRCQKLDQAGLPPKVCEIAQALQVQGQTAPIAQIAFGQPPKESLKLTVALPTSVSFPSSVRIATSDTDPAPLDLAWRRCIPSACFADAAARDDLIRSWKNGSETAQITFTDGAGREVKLPFSLRGFAQALEALNKG